jgi:hypothetical protein
MLTLLLLLLLQELGWKRSDLVISTKVRAAPASIVADCCDDSSTPRSLGLALSLDVQALHKAG